MIENECIECDYLLLSFLIEVKQFYGTYTMSRTQTSGFGTMGAAFLYFDALKRHAIFDLLDSVAVFTNQRNVCPENAMSEWVNPIRIEELCHQTAKQNRCLSKEKEN